MINSGVYPRARSGTAPTRTTVYQLDSKLAATLFKGSGKPYFHIRDREGKSLTRKYLVRQLTEMGKSGGLIKNLR